MTSPIPPHPSEPEAVVGRACALRPPTKILLATSVLLLGLIVAAGQLRPPEDPGRDPSDRYPEFLPETARTAKRTSESPVTEIAAATPATAPLPVPPTALPDGGSEKYGQAYQRPVLVFDESLQKKDKSKPEPVAAEKPRPASELEFKPLYDVPTRTPVSVPDNRDVFKPAPRPESMRPTFDAILPLFEFAENFQPPDDGTMPDNPFQSSASPHTPANLGLVPLVPPEEEPEPLHRLRPLVPPSRQNKLAPLVP